MNVNLNSLFIEIKLNSIFLIVRNNKGFVKINIVKEVWVP